MDKLDEGLCGKFMGMAIREAQDGVESGAGGPFGCVVVIDGDVVGRGHNQVVALRDPTAHGEVQALRDATKNTGRYHLPDAYIFTTGQPCVMCLGAVAWAKIPFDHIVYGCSADDIAAIGFQDKTLLQVMCVNSALYEAMTQCMRDECLSLFEGWQSSSGRQIY